ncbi:hypothetical protein [Acidicapsa acidisoli]|uniref:hypothetical protein n=1 Tax=Acidicapsa acidisoli TaxID=1615681 RepID=UPI0021E06569|nr:hypothetical protein [Acidicapsa acidisoli]
MTQCSGGPAEEMGMLYLTGELSESDAESFENHYFSCDLCHGQVLALQAIRESLAREPVQIATPEQESRPVAPARTLGARLLAFPVPLAVLGSIAASLVVVAALIGVQRAQHVVPKATVGAAAIAPSHAAPASSKDEQTNPVDDAIAANKSGKLAAPPQNSEIAALADLRLPEYQQPQLRGEEPPIADHEEFLTGMQAYSKGDCADALSNLARVPVGAADGVAARLYTGLCQFKERTLGDAQTSFSAVIAAGDTPQLETAQYFLAQTRMLDGDSVGARKSLNQTIALHGDYEERAQKQELALDRDSTQRSR